ncbi:hypothetical protein HZC00_05095 [Candidatus Kaiserbacteria bacterium]|nr:hypothetical protein [Candidatus Kaiserbacteria bacterium]
MKGDRIPSFLDKPKKHNKENDPDKKDTTPVLVGYDKYLDEELGQFGIDISKIESAPIEDLLPRLLQAGRFADYMAQEDVEGIMLSLARNKSAEFFSAFAKLLDFDDPKYQSTISPT